MDEMTLERCRQGPASGANGHLPAGRSSPVLGKSLPFVMGLHSNLQVAGLGLGYNPLVCSLSAGKEEKQEAIQ